VEFEKKGAQILGASFDTVEDNAAFAERFHFPFPLLCDTERTVGLAYGACDDPQAPAARRISYIIGPDGRVKKAYGKVDASSHPLQVLEDL
jgi:thioredoxin-dependent peroxiredoxin